MARREWTIMVYATADETALRKAVYATLQQIAAAKLAHTKVVAEVKLSQRFTDPLRRYDFELKPAGVAGNHKFDRANRLLFTALKDKGPRENLVSFMQWASKTYPARRYALVLQGHSWGADYRMPTLGINRAGSVLTKYSKSVRLIFGDPASKNALSNGKLSEALQKGSDGWKLDLLGLDSCLMCMAEICYQFRGSTKYVIAPEGFDPIAGWPFKHLLPALDRQQTATTEELGRRFLRRYAKVYAKFEGDERLTISMCDLRHSDGLATAVKVLSLELIRGLAQDKHTREAIIHTRAYSDHYALPAYIDLSDFCRRLAAALPRTGIAKACGEVIDSSHTRFVSTYVLTRGRRNSFGLSIFFPSWEIGRKYNTDRKPAKFHFVVATPKNLSAGETLIRNAYSEHDFAKATRWEEFLVRYMMARHTKSAAP